MKFCLLPRRHVGITIRAASYLAIFLCFFTLLPTQHSRAEDSDNIYISELMANPIEVTDSNGEWLEIINPTSRSMSLENWDIDGSTIRPAIAVSPGDSAVICRNSDTSANDGVVCDAQASLSLGNTGDTVELRNEANEVIDSLTYTTNDVAEGHSISTRPLAVDRTNQYSSSNYGTPAHNELLERSTQLRVHAVIDKNANGAPDWKRNNELHEADWTVRLYRDIGRSSWSYLGEVSTTGLAYRKSATFQVVPSTYYLCLVQKSGYTQAFARTITSYVTFPDRSVPSQSPASDEGEHCTRTTSDRTINSFVFGSAVE